MAKKQARQIERSYTGNPAQIINLLANDIADALQNAGISPSSAHVIALIHMAGSLVNNSNKAYATGDTSMGKMPSFKLLLRLLTHSVADSQWSKEEVTELETEFVEIVQSMGGTIMPTGTPSRVAIIAPESQEVH